MIPDDGWTVQDQHGGQFTVAPLIHRIKRWRYRGNCHVVEFVCGGKWSGIGLPSMVEPGVTNWECRTCREAGTS